MLQKLQYILAFGLVLGALPAQAGIPMHRVPLEQAQTQPAAPTSVPAPVPTAMAPEPPPSPVVAPQADPAPSAPTPVPAPAAPVSAPSAPVPSFEGHHAPPVTSPAAPQPQDQSRDQPQAGHHRNDRAWDTHSPGDRWNDNRWTDRDHDRQPPYPERHDDYRKRHHDYGSTSIWSFFAADEPANEKVVIERPAPVYALPSQTIIWNTSYRLEDRDRAVIANYYAYHTRYKPVLSAPQPIIYMGQPVPPSAYLESVPYDLVAQLQPVPEGFRYVLFGDNLLLIDPQAVVLDFAAL